MIRVDEETIVTFRRQPLFEDYLKQCKGVQAMDIKLSAFVNWFKKNDITQIILTPLENSPKPEALAF